ncbi:unnamed protein product [Musa acuminata subsp. malaccensis]|uniref:(wild Malaysian banana) hypothetical protein n=1 Tax=Musa acuminata subsp. malaccensis TaxID=214687 RepID=A0A804L8U1_MUSAM|nr:PREDICTED: E3 ubiquitin-protein ligase RNF170-like isoform X6 [Musa acuminata subsp. malaccensis]CAG1864845.1 unnamed protein product [Musa acuminata subsp. malaccensis]
MESPPQDDTCSICLGSFTHPCQANCSHWFCGECILSVWHHGSIFQQCKCPICRCFINLLKPTDASVQEGKDRKANQVLKTIKKYNRSFGGEPSNLMQKLQNLPFFIRRLAMVLMDPRRPLPSLFRAHITFATSRVADLRHQCVGAGLLVRMHILLKLLCSIKLHLLLYAKLCPVSFFVCFL